VCLEVDHVSDDQDWVSVIATGHVDELTGYEYFIEQTAAFARVGQGPLRWSLLDDSSPRGHNLLLFGLRIEEVTGRRDCWWSIPDQAPYDLNRK
jgi:hypothetical protein